MNTPGGWGAVNIQGVAVARIARRKPSADPVPVPSEAAAANAVESWLSFNAFSRDVFAQAHPGYEDILDGALTQFRKDPQRIHQRRSLDPAVGTGVALSSAIPFVLPVVAMFLGAVTERAVTGVVDSIERATRGRIARIIRDHHGSTHDVPQAAGALGLSGEEEGIVRGVVLGWGVGRGMDPQSAGNLADAVVRTLRSYSGDAG